MTCDLMGHIICINLKGPKDGLSHNDKSGAFESTKAKKRETDAFNKTLIFHSMAFFLPLSISHSKVYA